ncbi:MAG: hypothetical protein V7709_16910 [Halioglobus sp.]
MKLFALAVLMSVLATSAHAGSGKLSLLHCGLQLGDSSKLQRTYTAPRSQQVYGNNQVVKSIEVNVPTLAAFTGAKSSSAGRRRLPPTYTLARFVCSWR